MRETTEAEKKAFDEHLMLIGSIASTWNMLTLFSHILLHKALLPASGAAGPILSTIRSDSTQRDVILAAATYALNNSEGADLLKRIRVCFAEIQKLSGQRNAFIHSAWATSAKEPHISPLIPSPKLTKNVAEQGRALNRAAKKQVLELHNIIMDWQRLPSYERLFEQSLERKGRSRSGRPTKR